jgi:hypothetical protein
MDAEVVEATIQPVMLLSLPFFLQAVGLLISPDIGGVGGWQVRIHSLITEEALVKRSTKFEEAIAGGERSSLRNFCESKASAAG